MDRLGLTLIHTTCCAIVAAGFIGTGSMLGVAILWIIRTA